MLTVASPSGQRCHKSLYPAPRLGAPPGKVPTQPTRSETEAGTRPPGRRRSRRNRLMPSQGRTSALAATQWRSHDWGPFSGQNSALDYLSPIWYFTAGDGEAFDPWAKSDETHAVVHSAWEVFCRPYGATARGWPHDPAAKATG